MAVVAAVGRCTPAAGAAAGAGALPLHLRAPRVAKGPLKGLIGEDFTSELWNFEAPFGPIMAAFRLSRRRGWIPEARKDLRGVPRGQ